MTTRRYQLRISGLTEQQGHIKAATLQRVHRPSLQQPNALRVYSPGSGSAKGPRPRWLDATLDFTVTDLEPGSTIFGIDAPQLRDTASVRPNGPVGQPASTRRHSARSRGPGDCRRLRPCRRLLRQRTQFSSSGAGAQVFIPQGPAHGRFSLDETTCLYVEDRLKNIPAPRSVSGRLDAIKPETGRSSPRTSAMDGLHNGIDRRGAPRPPRSHGAFQGQRPASIDRGTGLRRLAVGDFRGNTVN